VYRNVSESNPSGPGVHGAEDLVSQWTTFYVLLTVHLLRGGKTMACVTSWAAGTSARHSLKADFIYIYIFMFAFSNVSNS